MCIVCVQCTLYSINCKSVDILSHCSGGLNLMFRSYVSTDFFKKVSLGYFRQNRRN